MVELYYAMFFDGSDEEKSNFYHCIGAAQNEDDFKTMVLKHRNVELTKIFTVTDYLKESGYKKKYSIFQGRLMIIILSFLVNPLHFLAINKKIRMISTRIKP